MAKLPDSPTLPTNNSLPHSSSLIKWGKRNQGYINTRDSSKRGRSDPLTAHKGCVHFVETSRPLVHHPHLGKGTAHPSMEATIILQ